VFYLAVAAEKGPIMGKKERRKVDVSTIMDNFKKEIRQGIAEHGKDFLVSIHQKLASVEELYDESDPTESESVDESEMETESEEEEQGASQMDDSSDSTIDSSPAAKTQNPAIEQCDSPQVNKRKIEESPPTSPTPVKKIAIHGNGKCTSLPNQTDNAPMPSIGTYSGKTILKPKNQTPTSCSSTSAEDSPSVPIVKSLMPPIICYNLNVAELCKYAKGKIEYFRIHNLNPTKSVITCKTREEFVKLRGYLSNQKTEFNTFTPKDERKTLLVLKGIHQSYDKEEVEAELRKIGIKVNAVTNLKRGPKGKMHTNFVVDVEKGSDLATICSNTFLLNQKVYWEKFKPKGISQCRNCQQFGHVASNCGMKYRCVKCKGNHGPGNCQRTLENIKDDKVFCVNCLKEGHPANYLGCPKYKEKLEARQKQALKRNQQRIFAMESAKRGIKQGISFAKIAKNIPNSNLTDKDIAAQSIKTNTEATTSKKPWNANSENTSQIFEDSKRLFGTDLLTLLQKARKIVPKNYGRLDDESRSLVLVRLICELCSQ
jgi:hypothetical protein